MGILQKHGVMTGGHSAAVLDLLLFLSHSQPEGRGDRGRLTINCWSRVTHALQTEILYSEGPETSENLQQRQNTRAPGLQDREVNKAQGDDG